MRRDPKELLTVELTREELTRIQVIVLDRVHTLRELMAGDLTMRKRKKLEVDLVNTIADLKILSTKVLKHGRV